jgi:CMP-N,N'-diacetyllegionaminic acid synthase
MLINNKIVALIPAKGTSLRIKNKNLQKLGEFSLVERKIEQLMKSSLIDEVYVGSDSEEILELSSQMGAIPVHRNSYFCDEVTASANEMIGDFITKVDADVIMWVHCINPFVDENIYDAALNTYFKNKLDFDSLISVTKIQNHLWYQDKPLNFDPKAKRHPLASTLEPLFYQNGAIFIQDKSSFESNSYFYGNNPFLFEIPDLSAIDINTEEDLRLARWLHSSAYFFNLNNPGC